MHSSGTIVGKPVPILRTVVLVIVPLHCKWSNVLANAMLNNHIVRNGNAVAIALSLTLNFKICFI